MLLQDITNTRRRNPAPKMHRRRFTKTKTAKASKPRITVHSLPNEILTEIFVAATFASEESRLDVPDVLSHVSSRWRAIVLNTSFFWTFIVVTSPFAAKQIVRAKAALVHSRNQPIDIHIDVRDPQWTWEFDEGYHAVRSVDMVEIMEWLGPSHPRWRSFSIFTDNWEPMQTFLAYSTMFSSLPTLEKLSLNRCNAYAGLPGTTPDSATPTELFGGNACLPKLRHVALSGVHIDYSCTGFKGLISLDLRHQSHGVSPSLQDLYQIFSASPELNSLSLVGLSLSCSHGSEGLKDAPITMGYLKKLTLGWWNVEDAAELLEVLRIPVVEELSLEDVGSTLLGNLEHTAFDDFSTYDSTLILDALAGLTKAHRDPAPLSPSSISLGSSPIPHLSKEAHAFPLRLRTLAINGAYLDPAAFSGFLSRLINLEELELKSVDHKLINALSIGMQPPSVDHHSITSNSGVGPALRMLKLWLSSGGFREAARALYEIKLRRPEFKIVNMVKLVLPEMVPNRAA